jgi:hypothetical protein
VNEYMARRWAEAVAEEERRRANAAAVAESPRASTPREWLTRSVSSLSTWVSDVTVKVVGQEKVDDEDEFLQQQF